PDQWEWCPEPPPGSYMRCYEFLYNLLSGVPYSHFTAPNFRRELTAGHGFVWHVEHSMREKLGDVTFLEDGACPGPGGQAWRTACQIAFQNANPGAAGDFYADMADRL